VSNQKNIDTFIRSFETQVGQISQQLENPQNEQFTSNAKINHKEQCKSITTRSGIVIGEGIGKYLIFF